MNHLRVFTTFSGYDSQLLALDRLGLKYDCVGWSEIDKYAIQAHNALYPNLANCNYGDITKIDWSCVPDFDLFTMSSPCQDFSVAGKGKGGKENSGTRSSLLWQCKKAITAKKPRIILFENVKAIINKNHIDQFKQWQNWLSKQGYTNHTQVMNAKDYGVPQNRERVFMISVLNDEAPFQFPPKFELKKRLKDVLETNVLAKYYLSEKAIAGFLKHNDSHFKKGTGFIWRPKTENDVANCLRANGGLNATDNSIKVKCLGEVSKNSQGGKIYSPYGISPTLCAGTHGYAMGYIGEAKVKQIGNLLDTTSFGGNPQTGRVYDATGISPCLNTMQGGGRQPKILQRGHGFNKGGEFAICPTITSSKWKDNNFVKEPMIVASRGRNIKNPTSRISGQKMVQRLEPNIHGICNTLTTVQKNNLLMMPLLFPADLAENYFLIRRLTPRECFRLMGLRDVDIDKIKAAGLSDTQQYKMAGNSIVVDSLASIFKSLASTLLLNKPINTMTSQDFFKLVERMRQAQSKHSHTGLQKHLQERKQAEQPVDDEINRVKLIMKTKQNPTLDLQ